MNNITILEFPFNLGLKEQVPGYEPGVKKLPDALREHGFHRIITTGDVQTLSSPNYALIADAEQSVLNVDSIIEYAKKQVSYIDQALSERKFPIVLGGDCSIVTGIALALKQRGNYALFYLDGHTDFIEPDLSETKAVGGMAAAIVAGRGHSKLTNINNQKPYIKEEHVWCVGNREYDDEYENAIRFSQAQYISLDELRKKGILECVTSFLYAVQQHSLDGFWLHIDVDVLDDEVMPAVDSRTPGGLTYDEFNAMLRLLLTSSKIVGFDIAILDPEKDENGIYTEAFVNNLAQVLKDTIIRQ
jgi:arginase